MIRLTHERMNGIKSGYWSPHKKDELVARLAEYENTGLDPEEIRAVIGYAQERSPLITKIINRNKEQEANTWKEQETG